MLLLRDLFADHRYDLPDSLQCPHCSRKPYKVWATLKKHIEEKHPGAPIASPVQTNITNDGLAAHTRELLKMLLLKRHLDSAIKSGNGEAVYLSIKFMFLYFSVLGNTKYRIACFDMMGQVEIFASDKMKELIIHERFVNNLGRSDTNIPMDQDLEFSNRIFKENFKVMYGEPSDPLLDRLSKASDTVELVLDNFKDQFNVRLYHGQRKVKEELYAEDVKKMAVILIDAQVYNIQPGRTMHCPELKVANVNPLSTLDLYKMKTWLTDKLANMISQKCYK